MIFRAIEEAKLKMVEESLHKAMTLLRKIPKEHKHDPRNDPDLNCELCNDIEELDCYLGRGYGK